jgi:hypothetical protein
MPISSCLLLCGLATRLIATMTAHFRRVRHRSQPISIPVIDSLLRKHLPRPSGTTVRIHLRLVRMIQLAAQTEAFALVAGAFLVLLQKRMGARARIAIRRPR